MGSGDGYIRLLMYCASVLYTRSGLNGFKEKVAYEKNLALMFPLHKFFS